MKLITRQYSIRRSLVIVYDAIFSTPDRKNNSERYSLKGSCHRTEGIVCSRRREIERLLLSYSKFASFTELNLYSNGTLCLIPCNSRRLCAQDDVFTTSMYSHHGYRFRHQFLINPLPLHQRLLHIIEKMAGGVE